MFGLALGAWLLSLGFAKEIPAATFVLQAMGLGTFLGTGLALWQRKRDPGQDMAWTIALFTFAAGVAALGFQLLSLVA
jgi:hypothetical protein